MKILCLNAWGGRVNEALLKFIKSQESKIDIFCFQEIFSGDTSDNSKREKPVNQNLFKDIAALLPKHLGNFTPCARSSSGLATFISKEIEIKQNGEVILFENPGFIDWNNEVDYTRKMAWFLLSVGGRDALVMNLHGHWVKENKDDDPDRLLQSARIVDLMSKFDCPKVLCGDFNLRPGIESVRMIERTGMRNLITEYKVTSTRSSLYTRKEKFADFVFVSPGIVVKDFQVFPDAVSDHLPLFLDFEVG